MKYILLLILICFSLSSCSRDDKETQHLIDLANQGNSDAMYNLWLGVAERMDAQTSPTIEEINKARKWLVQAGELNNWRAAHVLALCYSTGCWDFEINEVKAKHYRKIHEEFRSESPPDK